MEKGGIPAVLLCEVRDDCDDYHCNDHTERDRETVKPLPTGLVDEKVEHPHGESGDANCDKVVVAVGVEHIFEGVGREVGVGESGGGEDIGNRHREITDDHTDECDLETKVTDIEFLFFEELISALTTCREIEFAELGELGLQSLVENDNKHVARDDCESHNESYRHVVLGSDALVDECGKATRHTVGGGDCGCNAVSDLGFILQRADDGQSDCGHCNAENTDKGYDAKADTDCGEDRESCGSGHDFFDFAHVHIQLFRAPQRFDEIINGFRGNESHDQPVHEVHQPVVGAI